MKAIHEAVLEDLLREHPLPRLEIRKPTKGTKVKSGVRAGSESIMWTVKFR